MSLEQQAEKLQVRYEDDYVCLSDVCNALRLYPHKVINHLKNHEQEEIHYRLITDEKKRGSMEAFISVQLVDKIMGVLSISANKLGKEKEEDLDARIAILNHKLMFFPAFARFRYETAVKAYKDGYKDFLDFVEGAYANELAKANVKLYERSENGTTDRDKE